MDPRLEATLLHPDDDVATALVALQAGSVVRVAAADAVHAVRLRDPVAIGHKFALRDLAAGLRIRKYGEFIGRTTHDVSSGAWVHVHNLTTGALRSGNDLRAWCDQADAPANIQAVGRGRTAVGESPVWDADLDRLYWIDVRQTPAIHMLEPGSGVQRSWPLQEDVGSIALAGRNRLLAALRSGLAYFAVDTGKLTPIVDPEPDLPANRMNDGKCDPAGRFWCGSMNPESRIAEGSLYVLDPDQRCRRVLDDFLTPNGPAWSVDGRTMYLSDTRRGMIYAFAFDVATGTLGERRVFADLGALPGGPDGATIDADDYLWSAQFDGSCVIRYDPTGRMDRVIRLPVTKPTSCSFGGEGYRQLFVTTATRGLTEEALRAEPLAGRVLVLDVGIAGLPPVAYAPVAVSRERS